MRPLDYHGRMVLTHADDNFRGRLEACGQCARGIADLRLDCDRRCEISIFVKDEQ